MSKKILPKTGDIFGEYIVIDEEIKKCNYGKINYHVKCSCGKEEY